MKTLEEKVNYLMDRAELEDVISRYTYGMDARDWDLYRSAWIDGEIYFDANEVEFAPAEVRRYHIDHWIEGLKALFRDMPASQHLKVPVRFEIDGDTAKVLCLMQGKHYMPNDKGEALQTVVGYYLDDFIRTAEGWRMRGCREIIYWHEGNQHVLDANVANMFEALSAPLPR